MKYHNKIKELREDLDLSQKELGLKFNISQKAISQYERQEREIPNDLIIEFAKFFNVTTDYLLGVSARKGD
ncbi:MAG: helix-turn-helix domain-containing protein [bacterium]